MKKQKLIIPTIIALGASLVANTYADTASTDFSITVNPSASLTVSASSVNLDMTPTQAGVYDSDTLTVTASTNNTTGYTLVLETNNTALESNTINPNTGSKPTIPSIAEFQDGITAAAFEASTDSNILNHWGLAIGSANFNAIKASQTLKTTNAPAVGDTTILTMASKLDLLTVPGIYSTTLNFEMTTNPLPDTLESAYAKANKQKATIGGNEYYAMQDMNSTICADVDISSKLQVYDTRDNHIYTIGRLADNRCWLLDNLALDLTDSTVLAALSDINTNASATALGYLRGTTTRDPSQDPNGSFATAGVASWASNDSYSAPLVNKAYKDATNSSDPLDIIKTSKYGIYYNYCAASAGSYCYGNGMDYGTPSGDAEYDICPSGWRMPTSASGGEYQTLYDAYSSNVTTFRTALLAPLSGFYYNGSLFTQGNKGWFWSSIRDDVNGMYSLDVESNNVDPSDYSNRYDGNSVRCIAK